MQIKYLCILYSCPLKPTSDAKSLLGANTKVWMMNATIHKMIGTANWMNKNLPSRLVYRSRFRRRAFNWRLFDGFEDPGIKTVSLRLMSSPWSWFESLFNSRNTSSNVDWPMPYESILKSFLFDSKPVKSWGNSLRPSRGILKIASAPALESIWVLGENWFKNSPTNSTLQPSSLTYSYVIRRAEIRSITYAA